MRITMVGTGYVGLVSGACFANSGNHVMCLDIDANKVQKLCDGISPIYEPGLDDIIKRNTRGNRLEFTTDATEAYRHAQIIFICVGTPSDDRGRADLSAVLGVASAIGQAIEDAPTATGGQKDDDPAKIIVVKSTVPVGTNVQVKAAIAERTGKAFHMASNPEFLKEGAAINDFNKPDRVVIGVEGREAGRRMSELYDPFVRQGNPIFVMDIPSAEMVKYAANTMLATKISFINEIAAICEAYGADVDEVHRGMCSDSRIGNQFLYPGLGYGGSCFPKDVLACISMGEDSKSGAQLLNSVHEVNQQQRKRFISKIDAFYGSDLADKHFAIWGLAFKPETDDMREAPSVTIIEHLLEAGARVSVYDPEATETAKQVLGERVAYADNAMSVLDGADALVICTDWLEFKNPDFDDMLARLAQPVIFDGRNLYRPESMKDMGFTYHSVGRQPVGDAVKKRTP